MPPRPTRRPHSAISYLLRVLLPFQPSPRCTRRLSATPVTITHLDVPIRAVSSLSLYLGWLERGFGGLFLDLLRRCSNRSRFCGKQKKAAPPPAQEEMCSEPANERVEGDEQSEAPETPGRRGSLRGAVWRPVTPSQGGLDDTCGMSLNDDASRAGGGTSDNAAPYGRLSWRGLRNFAAPMSAIGGKADSLG